MTSVTSCSVPAVSMAMNFQGPGDAIPPPCLPAAEARGAGQVHYFIWQCIHVSERDL
jgi:hypothetical protein